MPHPSVKSIWLELQIDPNDRELLSTLDQLVRSGMLEHAQILELARTCLTEDLPSVASPVAIEEIPAVEIPETPIPVKIPSQIGTAWKNLRDELSVRWLLFLGVFLVVLSSGVLAATQWELFPAWGQYGLLWVYTIGFWVVGGWARRQEGLKLTANTLQLVALLLIPVNFWAIDSFGLWQQPLGVITAMIAGLGLSRILYLKYRQQQRRTADRSGWLFCTYLVLSCLQLGWQIPFWATISIYIGAIGLAIVLQKSRQIEGGALAIYGLGILLVRGLFVAHLPIDTFGLAIGIVGWLFTQWGLQKHRRLGRLLNGKPALVENRLKPLDGKSIRLTRHQVALAGLSRLYQRLGAILLVIGWLVGLSNWVNVPIPSSWQAIAVSCLALVWIWQRLSENHHPRELTVLFLVGLQAYIIIIWLWLPWAAEAIVAKILPLLLALFGQNYPIASSLLIFPYLLAWVWITDWFWHRHQPELTRRGESLILWTGAILMIVNISNPLSLLIDLAASTAILAHLTLRYLPVRSSYVYLTHFTGLATIFAALAYREDWCRSIAGNFVAGASTSALDLVVLVIFFSSLTVVELWVSAQPVRRESDAWQRSSWRFGMILAIFAYCCFCLLATLPMAQSIWPIWWSIVPVAFTYVATCKPPVQPWQLNRQTTAAWCAIGGLGASLLLVVNQSQWRSILLIIAIGLMFAIVKRLKQVLPAAIQIGFGLGLGVNLFAGHIFPSYWLVIGALTCAGLWFVSRKLPRAYAVASDRWAMGLGVLGLAIGSNNYISTDLNWLAQAEIGSLQAVLAAGSTNWFQSVNFTTLLAAGTLVGSIDFRRRWQDASIPEWICLSALVWASQIALAALVHLLGGNTLILATINILLAFPLWIWASKQSEPALNIFPGLLAGWGLILRVPFFNAYTGLLTILVGVIGILVSQNQRYKPIGYGGLLLVTLGCYELGTYQLIQAPPGGNLADGLTIYGLVTALLAFSYRLGVWWQARTGATRWFDFQLQDLKKVAHIHWAVASIWNILAATMPVLPPPQLTLLYLLTSVLLGGYALIQARGQEGGDWWVYLGLAELVGLGIYARSIFPSLGVVDEYLMPIACLVGILALLAPWQQWGWQDRPWRLAALILPLLRVVFELDRISLLNLVVLAVFYGGVARQQRQFRWAYLSLVFVNWAGLRLLLDYQLTSPFWYALLVGLSVLAAVQWDPYWQASPQKRHYGRLVGSGLIAGTALVWHQPWLPIGIGLAFGILGLRLRVRAWLYVGTIVFLLTNVYQLLVLVLEYPVTKWAIGLLAGVLFITIAANFEKRKEQMKRMWLHWLDLLDRWD
jgi:hypothetical protein